MYLLGNFVIHIYLKQYYGKYLGVRTQREKLFVF
jgi:hypothetical protein